MNYLGIIRSERARALAPAVLELARDQNKRRNTLRSLVGLILRCYRDVSALRSFTAGTISLPSGGHKYDEVVDELNSAALRQGRTITIAHAPHRRTNFDFTAVIIVLRTLNLMLRAHISPRLRPYCDVLVQSRAFTLALGQQRPRHWVIIGDLSSYLIALAAASKSVGHTIVYWQYSFLDFKHMPVAADIAVILNYTGRQLAVPGGYHKPQSVYWRPRSSIAKLRLDALATGPLAAVLNVHADARALRRLEAYSKSLARPIEVRLHPNSKLSEAIWPDVLTKAPDDETLDAFARRHALLLGGNTQAQAKALSLGTPVVHCEGLDPLPFDHHGYVASGIVPGCTNGEVPNIRVVQAFFSSQGYLRELSVLMGPEPDERRPGLESFIARLDGASRPDGGWPVDKPRNAPLTERML